MTRVVIVCSDEAKADDVVRLVLELGGEVAAALTSITTVLHPAFGSILLSCVAGVTRVVQIAAYGDTAAVAILFDTDGGSGAEFMGLVAAETRRVFPRLPVAVGFAGESTDPWAEWAAESLGRPMGEVPVFRVDTGSRRQVLTLLAATLNLAQESPA